MMTLRSKPKRPYHPRGRLECYNVHFQNLESEADLRCSGPQCLLCGQSGLMQLQLLRTQKSFANTARNSRRARFLQTGRSSAAHPQDFRPASRCDRFQPPTSPGMPLRFETSADP